MKKLIMILSLLSINLFAEQYYLYHAKEIGEIKFPGFTVVNLKVYCIDGVQYARGAGPYEGFMTVLFNKNGKPKTCK